MRKNKEIKNKCFDRWNSKTYLIIYDKLNFKNLLKGIMIYLLNF